MTTIRTLASHEVVQRAFPRPPPEEKDELAMAAGRAVDAALSRMGYDALNRRKTSATTIRELAAAEFDDRLAEAGLTAPEAEREKVLGQVREVASAYRTSPIYGLPRPKSRIVLIGDRVGIYAQPDFWDGRARFYEMKSYRAIPPPPDIALQIRLFQLAFPNLESVLICFDRHAHPVQVTSATVPPAAAEERDAALRLAYDAALELGTDKVREYVEGTLVPYALPAPGGPAPVTTR